jgi:hypothetical protein
MSNRAGRRTNQTLLLRMAAERTAPAILAKTEGVRCGGAWYRPQHRLASASGGISLIYVKVFERYSFLISCTTFHAQEQ